MDKHFEDLLASQKRSIEAAIGAAGFEISDFGFGKIDSSYMHYWSIPVVVHHKTDSMFAFDFVSTADYADSRESRQRQTVRRPGRDVATEKLFAGSWDEQMRQLQEWLGFIRRELNPQNSALGAATTTVFVDEQTPAGSNAHERILCFISHSSQDKPIAEALADLLRNALSIEPSNIRCTSVLAYSLPFGVDAPETLRAEVLAAKVLIGLITTSSVESHWVLFELGARWGQGKILFSMLAGGADTSILPEPIRNVHAINASDPGSIAKFIGELAERLTLPKPDAWRYKKYVDSLTALAKATGKLKGEEPRKAPPPSQSDFLMLNQAGVELQRLSLGQRVALQLVYRSPGAPISSISQALAQLNFRDPDEVIIKPLTETSLVTVSGRATIGPSPYAIIASEVERFLSEARLL